MSHAFKFEWTCPYCGHENRHYSRPESPLYPDREVVYCDNEDGGCDKLVVVEPTVTVTVTVKTYKVEAAS